MIPGEVELSEAVKQLDQFLRRARWLRMAEPSLRIVRWQYHIFNQFSHSFFDTSKPLLHLFGLRVAQFDPFLGNLNEVAALVEPHGVWTLEPTSRVTLTSLT